MILMSLAACVGAAILLCFLAATSKVINGRAMYGGDGGNDDDDGYDDSDWLSGIDFRHRLVTGDDDGFLVFWDMKVTFTNKIISTSQIYIHPYSPGMPWPKHRRGWVVLSGTQHICWGGDSIRKVVFDGLHKIK